MAGKDDDGWDEIEVAIRTALVEAGLGDIVREVDEEAQADAADDDVLRTVTAPDRVFRLLAATERLVAGRAALVESTTELTERTGVADVRFIDDEGRDIIHVQRDRQRQATDARASRQLRDLIARLG